MTIGELIALLSQYPADTRVVVDGYEGGLDDPHVYPRAVVLGRQTGSYSGVHSGAYVDSQRYDIEDVDHDWTACVVVSRDDEESDWDGTIKVARERMGVSK